MFELSFTTKANGLPVISSEELDILGERLVADFSPMSVVKPQEIDIDRFVTRYLGMKQDFQYLSHCGVYLGITIFQSTPDFPVYNPETRKAQFLNVEARTIIIDSSLAEENQEHRYRFTMAHEGSHSILHPSYFLNAVCEQDTDPFTRCRADFLAGKNLPSMGWTDKRRAEQQANRLGSAILMPKSAVKIALARVSLRSSTEWIALATERLEKTFNVSNEAARYRLEELGFISAGTVLHQ